jgi:tetratricopeptide (TPR) repeat protein
MEKLTELNLADPQPHPFIEWWFYSHPAIAKRIQMAKSFVVALLAFTLLLPAAVSAQLEEKEISDREKALKKVEERSRAEVMNYFQGNPTQKPNLNSPIAIELYNQAVEFFEKREFSLAREAVQDSLNYDSKNPFAHELLGDVAYYEQKLPEAKTHYEDALKLQFRKDLKEKIEKLGKENRVEEGLATYGEERFIIKYAGEDRGLDGAQLQEILRKSYRKVSQDLGYYLKHKVIVILYDEQQFREISEAPHWSSGVYDGKIRLPAYQAGISIDRIEKIILHEMTHAFVGEIAKGQAPAWLNEGLAEFEESDLSPESLRVFRAAIKTGALFPIEDLFSKDRILEIQDPLEAELFYVQSRELVKFIVSRFGLFHVKKMIQNFSQGKDSFEAVESALKISPLELEKIWKETFPSI